MQIPRIVHQLWKTETIPARWQDAVRQADDAMYQAKAAGRNRAIAAHLRR